MKKITLIFLGIFTLSKAQSNISASTTSTGSQPQDLLIVDCIKKGTERNLKWETETCCRKAKGECFSKRNYAREYETYCIVGSKQKADGVENCCKATTDGSALRRDKNKEKASTYKTNAKTC